MTGGPETQPSIPSRSAKLRARLAEQWAALRPSFCWASLRSRFDETWASLRAYFLLQDPDFITAFVPALALSALIFVRSPLSNYIFDEQEALLANPFVNGKAGPIWHAFKVDFWGLPPTRSIGSYRPLPDLIWRALWYVSHEPFLHHCVNVVVHAANAALLAGFVFAITRRRAAGWLAGACFLSSAVLTEAVTGVVGIADVLAGLFVLLGLHALRRSLLAMPAVVFATCLLGLFSKESVLVTLPLLPWAALLSAPLFHSKTPLRFLRALICFVMATAALVVYTLVRKHFYPVADGSSPVSALPGGTAFSRGFVAFLHWFQQPQLPHDAINNPLVDADFPHRVAGALRVYARGFGQVVFPWTLSGDYSFAQEPVPKSLLFPGSVLGGALLVVPPLCGVALWVAALVRESRVRRRVAGDGLAESLRFETSSLVLLGVALVWLPVAYFPHSNIPVLLPTVRAERFWYLPVLGSSSALALLLERARGRLPVRIAVAFFAVQVIQARSHAIDYTDDLMFWRSTRNAAPLSAKAQLNYSVMLGARGKLSERLAINAEAVRLAPQWAMAHVYYGDTLCRMHRPEEAFPHYVRGFELAPNDSNLIALALQCLWDEKGALAHKDELLDLGDKYPGSWLAFLASDLVYNGTLNSGVPKKYRPRSYDEGPKDH
ncbi:MAG TPA: tetratricopeptide repeat protein [Polyangiaceae bacterium]|jgi:hypothetical protein